MERVRKQDSETAARQHALQRKTSTESQGGEFADRINNSPEMIAQRKKLDSLFGGAVQRVEEEEPLQGKFETAQRVEEEEPLQGKFETTQRVEEEEPLQGKFETAQRVEEEEPLQGKFETAQRVEEEEPLQGKFEAVQRAEEEEPLQGKFEAVQRAEEEEPLQGKFEAASSAQLKEEAAKPNNTGLPDNLKNGIESLSGMSMDGVNVHYNSSQPAQLNALAYAQGTDIHVAPGQEKHLPHEAWHVVQQAQGRVQPTKQMKAGVPVNDDQSLEHEADVMGANALSLGNELVQKQGGDSDDRHASDQRDDAELEQGGDPDDWQWVDDEPKQEDGSISKGSESKKNDGEIQPGSPLAAWFAEDENVNGAETEDKGGGVKKWVENHENEIKTTFEGVSSAGSETKGLVENINEVNKSSHDSGVSIYQKSDSIWNKIFGGAVGKGVQSVLGVLSNLVSPLIGAGMAIADAKLKWTQWSAYENAVVDSEGKKKPNAPKEAEYGLTKVHKGFFRKVGAFFVKIWEFTSNLLTIIPSGVGQIVGLAGKIALNVGELIGNLAGKVKKLWQSFRGEKKVENSNSLFESAQGGDQASLELILSLQLPSIAGSGYKMIDKLLRFQHNLSEAASSKLKGALGLDATRSERVIDQTDSEGERKGAPKNTEELKERLVEICANDASKKLIQDEIKESMTGVGT